jgi:hypothetical protein
MCRHVFGDHLPEVSKDLTLFILKVKQSKNKYSREENLGYITKVWTLEWVRGLWKAILHELLHLENGGKSILRNVEKYNPNVPQKTLIFSSTVVRTSNLA